MKVTSTLLLLTGASALVNGLNIGKRDEGGILVGAVNSNDLMRAKVI